MYKIGDTVWYATYQRREISIVCPICFGKLKVTLILGNDDTVIMPCTFCGRNGYEPPSGKIQDYDFVKKAQLMTITEIEQISKIGKEEIKYHSEYCVLDADRDFDTEEAAQIKCEELCREAKKEQETRVIYLKKEAKKSFIWNAGYHLRESKNYYANIIKIRCYI